MADPHQHLYTAEQIRQAEQIAMRDYGISGWQMMQTAGAAAFKALQLRWPNHQRIVVLCGAGNNAGDGYVFAALALQAGKSVTVQTLADSSVLQGDALTAFLLFSQLGGTVSAFLPQQTLDAELIVDALFGTGLSRPITGAYQAAIEAINRSRLPVLSIDIPSGLHADSGCALGSAVKADITLSFIAYKQGLFTGQAADYCGEILLDDLALPAAVLAQIQPAAQLYCKSALPMRLRCAHKGHFGHVLLIGGNRGYSGAIRLAGEAALRSGAGLVSVATHSDHAAMLNIGRPELMCHGVESSAQIASLLEKATVIVIGPGLGQDNWAEQLLTMALATDKSCVIDADALNLLAKQPYFSHRWVLTPHPGEAARLLGCTTATIGENRFAAATRLQQRYGGVCLLKGAGTLVADGENCFVIGSGNPGMATGGMGDVLAGLLGGLLAQGLSPIQAGCLAAHVHGEAADQLANTYGERGLLANDLPPVIRNLLN